MALKYSNFRPNYLGSDKYEYVCDQGFALSDVIDIMVRDTTNSYVVAPKYGFIVDTQNGIYVEGPGILPSLCLNDNPNWRADYPEIIKEFKTYVNDIYVVTDIDSQFKGMDYQKWCVNAEDNSIRRRKCETYTEFSTISGTMSAIDVRELLIEEQEREMKRRIYTPLAPPYNADERFKWAENEIQQLYIARSDLGFVQWFSAQGAEAVQKKWPFFSFILEGISSGRIIVDPTS